MTQEIVSRSLKVPLAVWEKLRDLARSRGFTYRSKPCVNRYIIQLVGELTAADSEQATEVQTRFISTPCDTDAITPDEDGTIEKFTDVLPPEWVLLYRRLKTNPNLLNLREDLAFIEILQREVLSTIQTGECTALWVSLNATATAAKVARKMGDIDAYNQAIDAMFDTIRGGAIASQKRAEAVELSVTKGKLVDLQSRIDLTTQQVLPRSTYIKLVELWKQAVLDEVGDETLNNIAERYNRLLLEQSIKS